MKKLRKFTRKEQAYLKATEALMTAAKAADKAQANYQKAIDNLRKVENKMTGKELLMAVQLVKTKKAK